MKKKHIEFEYYEGKIRCVTELRWLPNGQVECSILHWDVMTCIENEIKQRWPNARKGVGAIWVLKKGIEVRFEPEADLKVIDGGRADEHER